MNGRDAVHVIEARVSSSPRLPARRPMQGALGQHEAEPRAEAEELLERAAAHASFSAAFPVLQLAPGLVLVVKARRPPR